MFLCLLSSEQAAYNNIVFIILVLLFCRIMQINMVQ